MTSLYLNLGRPTGRLPPVNLYIYIIYLGRQFKLLFTIGSPRLCTIQKDAEPACLIHFQFSM